VTDTLPDNGGYVAAAYLVFLALLLIYLAIASIRASRLERRLAELNDLAADRDAAPAAAPEPAAAGSET
jgi:hypothetical protein